MMTTAYDTVLPDGSKNTDPFEQGAGQIDAKRYLNPGLLYLNGFKDWAAFLDGKGLSDFPGIDPIDGSDLNQASISIGSWPARRPSPARSPRPRRACSPRRPRSRA